MKLNNKIIKGLFKSLALLGALFLVGPHIGIDPKEAAIFYGKILVLIIPFNLIFWFLDKKGIIDLKKEEQERLKLQKKLKSNKKNVIWFFGALVGLLLIIMIPIYLFSTPLKDNPGIRSIENELIQGYYWVFCIVFYSFNTYVFLFGKKLLAGNKRKRIGHYLASFFAFTLFTTSIILANDQPNLVLVMSCLCTGVTWIQFAAINIYKIMKEDETRLEEAL
ncbi:hypothetical protein EP118_13800 [Halobacteriovorax sp. Y22]|nr:hypothetical protein EP118_13800 [Halobacteriovorax sp. Y22]